MGYLFLGETLTTIQLIGFGILLLATFLALIKYRQKINIFTKGYWLIVVAALGYSTYAIVLSYLGQTLDVYTITIWSMILMAIITQPIFLSRKFTRDFKTEFPVITRNLWLVIGAVAFFDILGVVFNLYALALAPASLVFAVSGFQAIVVFTFAWILSNGKRKYLDEDFSLPNTLLKLSAIVLLVVGIWVLK